MSEKIMDAKNRWRSKQVGFRMSPEEAIELDNRVKLSGMQKQDYLIQSVLYQEITVRGHRAMYDEFRKHLLSIEIELKRLNDVTDMDDELLTPLKTILEIMQEVNKL
ncbi:MAG: plasmid mobilization protein [Lachnospiraceae bacterium]